MVGAGTYKHDKLHETLATHEDTNSPTLAPLKLTQSGCHGAPNDLTGEGNGNNTDHIGPGDAIVEQAKIGAETRQRKVQGQEEHRHQILNLFGQLYSKASLMRTDQTNEEGTEDGMHTDGAYTLCVSLEKSCRTREVPSRWTGRGGK